MKIKDFLGKDYDYVSYRITEPNFSWKDVKTFDDAVECSIFAGTFAIRDGKIRSLDGDIYSEEEDVLFYREWSKPEEKIKNGLTIVVDMDYYSAEEVDKMFQAAENNQ